MLKISSKRRRTLAQIKADKEAAAQKEQENEARIQQVHELQERLMQLEQQAMNNAGAQDLLGQFIRDGAVEQTGGNEFVVNVNGTPTKFQSTVVPGGRQEPSFAQNPSMLDQIGSQ